MRKFYCTFLCLFTVKVNEFFYGINTLKEINSGMKKGHQSRMVKSRIWVARRPCIFFTIVHPTEYIFYSKICTLVHPLCLLYNEVTNLHEMSSVWADQFCIYSVHAI
jgi:hypothetical protein